MFIYCNIAGVMPAARGVKRAASKSSASTASTAPKNKKKRTGKFRRQTFFALVFFTFSSDVNDLSKCDGGKACSFIFRSFISYLPYSMLKLFFIVTWGSF